MAENVLSFLFRVVARLIRVVSFLRFARVVSSVCVGVFVHSPAFASTPGRLGDVIDGLHFLEDTTANLCGVGMRTSKSGDRIYRRSKLSFVIGDGAQRVERIDLDDSTYAAHGQSLEKGYRFSLKKNSQVDNYAVSNLERLVDDTVGREPGLNRVVTGWLNASSMIYGRSLAKVLTDDGTVVKSAGLVDGGEFFQVVFSYSGHGKETSMLNTTVQLMPKNNFSISSYSGESEIGGFDGVVEYFPPSADTKIALPRKVVVRERGLSSSGLESLGVDEFEFKSLAHCSPTGEEFTLASFGVEEVDFGGGGFGKWRIFFSVATALILIVALWLRKPVSVAGES